MYFIVGLCRAAQRHERHNESFCSFFAKKEPKKLPTIFHKPYRECGKRIGVFPLRGFGHTRIRGGESEKPMEKQSLQAFFPVFSIRLLLWGSRGRAAPEPCPAPRNAGLFACGAMPRNRAHRIKRDAKTNAKRWFRNTRPRNRGHWAGHQLAATFGRSKRNT